MAHYWSLIPQEFSWGRLLISEEGFRKLSTFHSISPVFLDFVRAFGEKTTYYDDTFGGYRSEISRDSPVVGMYTAGSRRVEEKT